MLLTALRFKLIRMLSRLTKGDGLYYITIKIRGIGRNPQLPVSVVATDNGYKVTTQDPAWAPALGQPLVFYRNKLVIGGGIVVGFN